jgi:Fe-S-cluster containining protein
MTPTEQLDCRACGACCHAREGTILVLAEDIVRWKRTGREDVLAQLGPGHFGEMAFAMKPSSHPARPGLTHCVHLGTPENPNDCSIYETRGTICREYAPGNPQCRTARRELGLT